MEAWTHSILATSLPTVRESSCEEERRVVKGLVVERYVDREREQPLYDRSKPINSQPTRRGTYPNPKHQMSTTTSMY